MKQYLDFGSPSIAGMVLRCRELAPRADVRPLSGTPSLACPGRSTPSAQTKDALAIIPQAPAAHIFVVTGPQLMTELIRAFPADAILGGERRFGESVRREE
jgi:hypothetical protein